LDESPQRQRQDAEQGTARRRSVVIERLLRLREPAVVVVLVVLGLRLLLGVANFAAVDRRAVSSSSSLVTDADTVLVVAVLAGSCLLWAPTPHARPLALASIGIGGLGILASLVLDAVWLTSVEISAATLLDGARLVLVLPVPVLSLVSLTQLLRAHAPSPPAPGPLSLERTADGDRETPREVAAQPADRVAEPTWQPDQAAGAAWLTAGDAAAGAAASGWGTPGEAGGWVPQPDGPPQPTQPPTRSEPTEPPRP
jgi:hypothetical protein